MFSDDFLFNYRSIRAFTSYECRVDTNTIEREISFHVDLGPSTERRGDIFPVHLVPQGRMCWLSDWSFNVSDPITGSLFVGGSLGRITADNQYIYVLNCSVQAGDMKIFSPARPIRFPDGEWLAVCFHQIGIPYDVVARATFRLTEVPMPPEQLEISAFHWWSHGPDDLFPGEDAEPQAPKFA